ncbi:GrpB family protein [Gulosibacter faecalis]|jgi:GrpB-like predicted nucleotidyltransferase (UPF0157 family)|uniref:GrpB family protein n=1 Tax=Gulosibacter faecalis TaxID=272240 RepID=A0ABW5V0K1_9MICO|nr:GrpB family protein [Gulosibacter faecalis]
MPTPEQITTFTNDAPPPGESPWVVPQTREAIDLFEPDPAWPAAFARLESRIRHALGGRALEVLHVGSTSVPGLPAKPVIDVDLIVADPNHEPAWLPTLVDAGFVLTVREPWWHGHRLVKHRDPAANVHVFGPDAPEPWKHRVFRDHLRRNAVDRQRYADVKRELARIATAGRETVMEYNARKQACIREIYERAFAAAGLRDAESRAGGNG